MIVFLVLKHQPSYIIHQPSAKADVRMSNTKIRNFVLTKTKIRLWQ